MNHKLFPTHNLYNTRAPHFFRSHTNEDSVGDGLSAPEWSSTETILSKNMRCLGTPTKVGRPQHCRLGPQHSTVSSRRRAAHWLSSKMATPLPPAPNIHRATDPGSPGSGLELTARACLQIRYPPLQNLQAGRRASSTVHYAPTVHVLVTDCTLHVVTPLVVATGHRRMFDPCQEPEKLQTAKGKRKVDFKW
jgi:hypothetical protein